MRNRDKPAFQTRVQMKPGKKASDGPDAYETTFGLTKREVAAFAAMQGYLAAGNYDCGFEGIAADSVKQADAVLDELEKRDAGE